MSYGFNYTTSERPWFRLGRIDVGTTMFVVLAVVASWIGWALTAAVSQLNLLSLLGYSPALAWQHLEIWRVFSWPLANGISIWSALTLWIFWMFGIELENQIGRARMAQLLVGIWAVLTLISTIVWFFAQAGVGLSGISSVQFIVMLLWIAEFPHRPFFFSIPAWVVGAVLVGIEVLQLLGIGDVLGIVTMAASFVLVSILARRLGLLRDHGWIPGAPSASRPSKQQRQAAAARAQRLKDDARLDQLLDKISSQGMDALSPGERRELMKLRNRRQ